MHLIAIVRTQDARYAPLKLVDGRLFGGLTLPEIAGTTTNVADVVGIIAFESSSLRMLAASLGETQGLTDALRGIFFQSQDSPEARTIGFLSFLGLPLFMLNPANSEAEVVAEVLEKADRLIKDPMREILDAINYHDIVHMWAGGS